MRQRNEHFFVSHARIPHVILHHGVAASEGMLGLQPLPDPLGSVPLFLGLRLVVFQDLIDNPQPRSQLGLHHRFLPLVTRRDRIRQHLPDGLARQPELPRRLPLAHPVHLNRSPHARIHFHLVHLPGVSYITIVCVVLGRDPRGGLLFVRHEPPLTRRFVVYYC